MTEIFGYLAAFLTTISFLPQAIMSIRTKNTDGISLGMYITFASGVACWLIYGIILKNFAMIAANSVTLPLALIILSIKIKNTLKR